MKVSYLLILLAGLGLLAMASCESTEVGRYTWEQLDSLYYQAPSADSTQWALFTDELKLLAQQRMQAYQEAKDRPDSTENSLDSLFALSNFHSTQLRLALVAGDYPHTEAKFEEVRQFGQEVLTTPWGGSEVFVHACFAQALQDTAAQAGSLEEAFGKRLHEMAENCSYTERLGLFRYLGTGQNNALSDWHEELTKLDSLDSLAGHQVDDLLTAYIDHTIYVGMQDAYSTLEETYKEEHYVVYDSLKIPMSDGTLLDGYVVLPKDSGPLPTILYANPYVRSMNPSGYGFYGADHNFATITVHPRGVRLSEGTFAPFEREAEDIPQIIDWIIQQPWSDGQVAMSGGSYLGFSQWAALKNHHPALKTIVPQVSVGIGIDFPYHNRVMMNYALQWINYVTNSNLSDGADFGNYVHWDSINTEWYTNGASFRSLDTLDGTPDSIFQRWLDHPDFDDYWQDMRVATPEEFASINIPILTTTGFFDADQLGALHYYNMHQEYGNPEVLKNHYLVIGPYDHGGGQGMQRYGHVYGYLLPREAITDITSLVYDWCNYVMRDGPKPEILKDRVNHYIMEQGWQHLPSVAAISDSLTLYPVGNGKDSNSWLLPTASNGTALLTEDFSLDSLDDFGLYPLAKPAELLEDFRSEG
ncbi:MAG: CocE/NonD family hydrolase, partial [Bacteroidota bacterium]